MVVLPFVCSFIRSFVPSSRQPPRSGFRARRWRTRRRRSTSVRVANAPARASHTRRTSDRSSPSSSDRDLTKIEILPPSPPPPPPRRDRRPRRASHGGVPARGVHPVRGSQGREHPARSHDAEEPRVRFRHLRGEVRARASRFVRSHFAPLASFILRMNPSPPSSPRGAVAPDPAVTPPSLPPSLTPSVHPSQG